MKRRRIILVGAVAAFAATAPLLGGVFHDSGSAGAPATPTRLAQAGLESGFSAANTAGLIRDLQAKLRVEPQGTEDLAVLGLAYQQRARETGDPAYYTKSDGVLRRALALNAKDDLAVSGLGSLALSRHRFSDALALGRQAHELNPYSARTWGVIGDALVELGSYREAFAAFDTMNR